MKRQIGDTVYAMSGLQSVFEQAELLYGEEILDAFEEVQPDTLRRIAYRDSGCMYSVAASIGRHDSFHTDPEIISDFLTGLSVENGLNAVHEQVSKSPNSIFITFPGRNVNN